MELPKIEEHRSKSKLEPHLDLIIEMRSKNWPYRDILKYLDDHFKLKASYSTLYSFCEIRGIKKNAQIAASLPVKNTEPKIMSDEEAEEVLDLPPSARDQNPFAQI